MKKELIVKKTIILSAEVSKVWDALTNPEQTKQYMFGCEAISDWQIGSPLIWKGAADGKAYVKAILLTLSMENIYSTLPSILTLATKMCLPTI